ncbi:MAG: hypothetical protein NWQ38_13930, partial [Cellulophaga sp.]|nr:hypothetical protein [Cellulophaga sp.]
MKTLYLRLFAIIFFLGASSSSLYAQVKIGDNPQTIDAASVLELESSDKALVIPRMNTIQMDAIIPLEGAMVYNTDAQCVHYYDGTIWINICEAFGDAFAITNDSVVNPFKTILIQQTDNNYNLEVGILTGVNLGNGIVENRHIIDGAITNAKIRDNQINSRKIINGSILPVDLSAGPTPGSVLQTSADGSTVNWAQITASNVLGENLTPGDPSIIVGNGAGATLTNAEIRVADLGITTAKLADGAVDNTKLADNAVTTDK